MPLFSRRRPAPPSLGFSRSEVLPFIYTPSPRTNPKHEKPLPPLPRTHRSPRKPSSKPLPPIPTSPVSPISSHGPHPFSPVSAVSRHSSSTRPKLSVYHPVPTRYYPPTDLHHRVQHFLHPRPPSAASSNVPASPDQQCRALLRQEICTLEKLRTQISRVMRAAEAVWALQCGKKVVEVHKRKLGKVVEEVKYEAAEVRWEFEGLKNAGAVGEEEVVWVCRLLREVEREVELARREINDLS